MRIKYGIGADFRGVMGISRVIEKLIIPVSICWRNPKESNKLDKVMGSPLMCVIISPYQSRFRCRCIWEYIPYHSNKGCLCSSSHRSVGEKPKASFDSPEKSASSPSTSFVIQISVYDIYRVKQAFEIFFGSLFLFVGFLLRCILPTNKTGHSSIHKL